MSANQSNLSAYGYDVVVATTQASLNARLKEYLNAHSQPETILCYVADENGRPTQIPHPKLVQSANGSDPFSVPDGADPDTNQDLKNLLAARFMGGFKARLGLPPGYAPDQIPDIVKLGANSTAVTYTMMCSEFVVVQYTPPSGDGPARWMNQAQKPGDAWLFTSKVQLRLAPTAPSDRASLPAVVQQQAATLAPGTFSIQRLLLDLDSAAPQSAPVISGVEPGTSLYAALQKDFTGPYSETVQETGAPLLGCSITAAGRAGQPAAPDSSLAVTDVTFWCSPYLGSDGQPVTPPASSQQALYTLDYVCAAGGNALPPAHAFAWNWMEPSDQSQCDGVVSINRNTLANYLKTRLDPIVAANCYYPDAASCRLEPARKPATVVQPPAGPGVLAYTYSETSSHGLGPGGVVATVTMTAAYQLGVAFIGNVIQIAQHLVVTIEVSEPALEFVPFVTADTVNRVVDKVITDTYTIAVDASGRLVSEPRSTSSDNAQPPSGRLQNLLSGGVAGVLDAFGENLRRFTSTALTDIPFSLVQDFVFPGGGTFLFKDAAFSEHQDLVAHITYALPA